MSEPTLVILAAGMGSRFGGLKQIDTIGTNGESIIDFSIYDAYQAGFRKLVLIIRREHEELFDELVTNNVRPFMDVTYAYQSVRDLPDGFECPRGRVKPWGTVQALLSTKNVIDGPFMVINSDDFYGRQSFEIMFDFLKNEANAKTFGMIGYQLNKTLTENGAVTRGICKRNRHHYLSSIEEKKRIIRIDNQLYHLDDEGNQIEVENGLCSMNYWGFTPDVFPYMEKYFTEFLQTTVNVENSELAIPTAVSHLISETDIHVKVMTTKSEWLGVTYPKDKEKVKETIASYKDKGIYPFDLWD